MANVILHFKSHASSKACAMCGANLAMSESRWRWWMRNTWTDVDNDYREGPGIHVFDWMVPCSSEIPTGASGDGSGNWDGGYAGGNFGELSYCREMTSTDRGAAGLRSGRPVPSPETL